MTGRIWWIWVSPGVYAGPFASIADVVAYHRWARDAGRQLRGQP